MIEVQVEHIPVLLDEVLDLLRVEPAGVYVDCTLGLGGHAGEILSRLGSKGRLIGLDRDEKILAEARRRLGHGGSRVECFHENFKNLPTLLDELGVKILDGCLLDLGVGSHQLNAPERGFSFMHSGPLDMRMDVRQETTAADLLNRLPEETLADIFRRYGEEKSARRLAKAIAARRLHSPFATTADLVAVVEEVKGGRRQGRIHPATQTFQALRIEVNQELEGLEEFLEAMVDRLAPGGRLVVLAFHSLEDRIVKTVFRRAAGHCVCFGPPDVCSCPRSARVKLLTGKPVRPSDEEIQRNPRSRSARLRAVEKLEEAFN